MSENNFSAKGPSLGYYYQIRYGLYLLLSEDGSEEKSLSFETLDDIVIHDVDSNDLFQTKYHLNNQGDLTDRSSDLWKTLRIWCTYILNKNIDPENTIFTLATTANCPKDSIIGKFIAKETPLDNVISEFDEISKETTNTNNFKGYKAYSNLTSIQKRALFENLQILDGSLDFAEIETKIYKILRLSAEPQKLSSLFERLEGWWFSLCISQLKAQTHTPISYKDLRNKILDIQDQLKKDNLPLDMLNPIEISDKDVLSHDQRIFVKQLKLIAIGSKTLRNAISDYHRAFQQRSKWLREDLLNPNDDERYEKRLIDDWKVRFELMEDEIDGKNDADLVNIGGQFYKDFYLNQVPPIFIRERFTEPFLTRGSCHILSDKKKIGWHPNFKKEI